MAGDGFEQRRILQPMIGKAKLDNDIRAFQPGILNHLIWDLDT